LDRGWRHGDLDRGSRRAGGWHIRGSNGRHTMYCDCDPAMQGVSGSAADGAAGVRDLLAAYLKGPSLKTVVLEASVVSMK